MSMSAYNRAALPPNTGDADDFSLTADTFSSTNEFQALQSGQRPSHFGDWDPQVWQE
jgi:hypothetical protein